MTTVEDLTNVTNCPACRANRGAGIDSQAGVYVFARPYLCNKHGAIWDAADERAHRGTRLCPHAPKPCSRCRGITFPTT